MHTFSVRRHPLALAIQLAIAVNVRKAWYRPKYDADLSRLGG